MGYEKNQSEKDEWDRARTRTRDDQWESQKQESHLSSPISQVIHGNDAPPTRLVQIRKERADDSAAQMSNMEGLGDVRRRILDDDFLALACVVRAVRSLTSGRVARKSVDLVEHFANHARRVYAEVQERFVEDDSLDPFIRLELSGFKRQLCLSKE